MVETATRLPGIAVGQWRLQPSRNKTNKQTVTRRYAPTPGHPFYLTGA
jgi:hypothetical protein